MKKIFEILFALAVSLIVDENPDSVIACCDGCEIPVEAYC